MKFSELIILMVALTVLTISPVQAVSDKELVKQGIKAFHSKQYQKAIDLLGGALSSEFQNPLLHYYLANSYMELGKNEVAIREYRIAHALEPESDVGKFSQQALNNLLHGKRPEIKEEKQPIHKNRYDQLESELNKTLTSLDKQTVDAMARQKAGANRQADSLNQNADMIVKRTELEMLKSMLTSGKKARLTETHKRQLQDLKEMYEARQKAQRHHSRERAKNISRSSQDLGYLLMRSRYQQGQHRLDPHGTGLYVRNYTSK